MEQLKQLDNNKSRWEYLQERCIRYFFVDINSGVAQLEDLYGLFMQMSTWLSKQDSNMRLEREHGSIC